MGQDRGTDLKNGEERKEKPRKKRERKLGINEETPKVSYLYHAHRTKNLRRNTRKKSREAALQLR